MDRVFFLIFIGAGIGGTGRYAISLLFAKSTHPFIGTALVNWVGSFLIGLIFSLYLYKSHGSGQYLTPLLIPGFLGGFTTLSAFSLETLQLIQQEHWGIATSYALGTVIISVALTALGFHLGKPS